MIEMPRRQALMPIPAIDMRIEGLRPILSGRGEQRIVAMRFMAETTITRMVARAFRRVARTVEP